MELTLNTAKDLTNHQILDVLMYDFERGSSHEAICLREDPIHLIRLSELNYWKGMNLPLGFLYENAQMLPIGPTISGKAIYALHGFSEKCDVGKAWPEGLDSKDYILALIQEYKKMVILKWFNLGSYKEIVTFGEQLSKWIDSIQDLKNEFRNNLKQKIFPELASTQNEAK